MTDKKIITQEFVIECFSYVDGVLIWKNRPLSHFQDQWRQKIFNSRQAGKEAGTVRNGYKVVNFSEKRMLVHRIVYLYHHGFLPKEIDHINRNTIDNRIENLREATHSQNCMNKNLYKSNTSGVKGVSFHKKTNKWAAGIRLNGKWKHLGLFDEIEKASMARFNAEKIYYGEFSGGR